TYLAGAVHRLAGGDITANLFAFKALSFASLLLAAFLVWAFLRRTQPRRASLGLFLVLWNPLALWESAGAGHNGLFSIAAVLLGPVEGFRARGDRRPAPSGVRRTGRGGREGAGRGGRLPNAIVGGDRLFLQRLRDALCRRPLPRLEGSRRARAQHLLHPSLLP